MATFVSKVELLKRYAEMGRALDYMTSSEHMICPECLSVKRVVSKADSHEWYRDCHCWCDYESPAINYQD